MGSRTASKAFRKGSSTQPAVHSGASKSRSRKGCGAAARAEGVTRTARDSASNALLIDPPRRNEIMVSYPCNYDTITPLLHSVFLRQPELAQVQPVALRIAR